MKDSQINDCQVILEYNSFNLCFLLAKELHNVELIVGDSIHDGRIANSVQVVHIDAIFNQKLNHGNFTKSAWIVQQSLSTVKLIDAVRVSFEDTFDFRKVVSDHIWVKLVKVRFTTRSP